MARKEKDVIRNNPVLNMQTFLDHNTDQVDSAHQVISNLTQELLGHIRVRGPTSKFLKKSWIIDLFRLY